LNLIINLQSEGEKFTQFDNTVPVMASINRGIKRIRARVSAVRQRRP